MAKTGPGWPLVVVFAVVTISALAIVFWTSYRAWGSLPSPLGPAALPYGIAVAGVAIVISYAAWAVHGHSEE